MNKLINKSVMVALGLGLMLPYAANATNGYFAHGYGTKNKGLAGGGTALPQDAMIAASNPAGMAFVGDRLDLGAAIFSPSPRSYSAKGAASKACVGSSCSFSVGPQTIESDNDFFLIPHFGRNWQLNPDSTVGVAIYGNGGMNTEYKGGNATFFNPTAGSFVTTDGTYGGGTAGVNLEQLFINAAFAHKLSATSSWGASAIYAYQRFEAKGLNKFGAFSLDANNLTDRGVDDSTGLGLMFGFQGELVPGLSVAASYRSKIDMDEFDKYKGLFAESGDFDIPSAMNLGFAWKGSNNDVFTFDIQKINYTDVAAVSNPIANLATQCTAGAPATGKGCLGGSNGGGFGWDDMTIYKIGYQWSSSPNWDWRIGFSTGKQPIPSSEVLFNILAPAVTEEHITFGFTNKMSKDSEFNFAAMYAPNASVSGKNAFDGGQTIELEMSQIDIEASWGWKF